jgi:hypothetical protein
MIKASIVALSLMFATTAYTQEYNNEDALDGIECMSPDTAIKALDAESEVSHTYRGDDIPSGITRFYQMFGIVLAKVISFKSKADGQLYFAVFVQADGGLCMVDFRAAKDFE